MFMITRLPVAAETGQVTLVLAPNRALSREQMRRLTWELCLAALVVAGLAASQVLAGAPSSTTKAELLYHDAPYGVGYLVASWK